MHLGCVTQYNGNLCTHRLSQCILVVFKVLSNSTEYLNQIYSIPHENLFYLLYSLPQLMKPPVIIDSSTSTCHKATHSPKYLQTLPLFLIPVVSLTVNAFVESSNISHLGSPLTSILLSGFLFQIFFFHVVDKVIILKFISDHIPLLIKIYIYR